MIEVGKLKQVAKKVKLITQDELFTSNLINYTSSNLDHVWFNVQHPVIVALDPVKQIVENQMWNQTYWKTYNRVIK